MQDLLTLQRVVLELQNTSSSINKKEILSKAPELKKILNYTFNPFKQYYVTSENILKNWTTSQISRGPNLFKAMSQDNSSNQENKKYYSDIYQLLDALDNREITGQKAITEIVSFISRRENIVYKDLILNIIDRDLKCHVGISIINKVWPDCIPDFKVALANSYWDNEKTVDFVKDRYYASRKEDGVRLLTIIDESGKIEMKSRNGKEITTLQRLKDEIKEIWPDLRSCVFDGEICIVDEDGNEHFEQIIRLINKKDYTIPFPKYHVFDVLSLKEFETGTSDYILSVRLTRWDYLISIAQYSPTMMIRLNQTLVTSREHLDSLFKEATDRDWEGLILRKDTIYSAKRSNDLLKVKAFHDAEYVVTRIGVGPFSITKDGKEASEIMMTQLYFNHSWKDDNGRFQITEVGSGSGLTLDQRREFYAHPDKIIGKTVTIKYFEETIDQNGAKSLRFPIIKQIYDDVVRTV